MYILVLTFAFLGTGLIAQDPPANTVWKNEGAAANWTLAEGWTNGIPGAVTKTVFNVPAGSDCIINTADATVKQLVIGDNNPYGGTLIIEDGGVLTCSSEGDWSTVGYNEGGLMAIKKGGALVVEGNRFHVGLVEPKAADIVVSLDVEGTIVTPKFTVNDGGKAWDASAYVFNGGSITTDVFYIGAGGLVDVSGGYIIVKGDVAAGAQAYVDAGALTAEGGDEAATITVKISKPGTAEADTTTWITSSTSVGIAPSRTAQRATLGVYPNPATDVVYFKENIVADVEIYSINGQSVLRAERVSQVNVEGLKPGYYVMKATADNKLYTEKLVIK